MAPRPLTRGAVTVSIALIATVLLGAVAHAGEGYSRSDQGSPTDVAAVVERYGVSVFLLMAAVIIAWRLTPSWIERNEAMTELAKALREELREQGASLHRLERRLGTKLGDDDDSRER